MLPSGPTQFQLSLCRQDTTSPWSTDYGGNICSLTLILMQAIKIFGRRKEKEKKKHFIKEETQNRKNEQIEKMKKESGVTLKWAITDPTFFYRGPKFKFSQKKIVFFTVGLLDDFFARFWRLLGRLKKNKEKTKIGKTFNVKKKTEK